MSEENNTDDIFFKDYWRMWNRACSRVYSMLTDLMGSLKWKQLVNSWKAGKIISFDSVTRAAQQSTALPDRAAKIKKQNKLPQNTSSEQQWETWCREITVSLSLILFCSHSGVLWLFCHPQSHAIPTLNHGPTCGYHRPSPNPSHNPDLNSPYTALKTFFSQHENTWIFFLKWL